MDKIENRIFFLKSAYPLGHKIERFRWLAELDPSLGILFHFDLESEDYNPHGDVEISDILKEGYKKNETKEPDPDYFWKTKYVWFIKKRCLISTFRRAMYNFYGDRIFKYHSFDGGILVGTESNKIDFENFNDTIIEADNLTENGYFDFNKKRAFESHIQCSECADHKIQISNQQNNSFDFYWTGKIAEFVTGSALCFCYEFEASISDVKFEGLYYPEYLTDKELSDILSKYSLNPQVVPLHKGKVKNTIGVSMP